MRLKKFSAYDANGVRYNLTASVPQDILKFQMGAFDIRSEINTIEGDSVFRIEKGRYRIQKFFQEAFINVTSKDPTAP